ncbi:succinate--CoA ligase subunit alpha [Dethiosulfatarculus sandiegensis]|uniref:Succinate--CoA ligase [ADP-forming] subunit alpha n=1 Tax=Dethiosulfatarculus sandiegensis TaxID=1429043 RepID=A0A0D2HZ30_9BACT|nr:succinate--CoA ligase subunit alpha [Dethiosulfatarculus sandiegensis]KIX15498.1 succinyl-CoA synthetase subsunit alpha [Dethiosulfatarculus sandiegensis]
MSILVNENSRIVVQGLTGKEGMFHAEKMIEYGSKVVAGVTPGKAGQKALDVPIFNTVGDAVKETGANVSVIFVPARFAADAICEASEAGVDLVVAITEHIPVKDMIMAKNVLKANNTKMVGPNCPGVISPGKCKVGIMPAYIHKQGKIGLISRSGTLTYEVVHQLTQAGLGQSTCIGMGGDPIIGLDFLALLKLFAEDPDTEAVVMIGEIGGDAEERAAAMIKEEKYPKPVFGFVAGLTAPPGKRMGHAGAIVSGSKGKASDKIEAMENAGITVVRKLGEFGAQVAKTLAG